MAVHSYVISKYISGTSKEDAQMEVRQMVEQSEFEIPDPKAMIAADMFQAVEQHVDPRYRKRDIRNLLDIGKKVQLRMPDDGLTHMVNRVVVKADDEKGVYHCTLDGEIRTRQAFVVQQIDDADVGYLVSEHIIRPDPGIMLAERCYHTYFRDLRSAIRYRDAKMRNYSHAKGLEGSGWRLTVVDINAMEQSSWYKANMQAAKDIKRYGLELEDYRYIADTNLLKDAIRADAYDDMDKDDQDDVNYGIYMAIRKFVDDDFCIGLDEELDDAGPGELEGIADTAIILALTGAKSQADMDAVSEALGFNAYRIGALTDDIFNAHPDEGFIMVSRDGDMCWYHNAYYANEWPGNQENPWFGKFQANENDTLLCFKEFHPELIVDRLPKPSELRELESKYITSISAERNRHDEMEFTVYADENDTDVDVCVGHWYCDGVASKKCYEGIHFMLEYGSHRFTEDECRHLLSGEEIVIEKFMSKVGREITIRGKLKDCSTMYDHEMNIQFTRTDISNTKRRRMDMDFGIETSEPGLPSEDGDGPVGI